MEAILDITHIPDYESQLTTHADDAALTEKLAYLYSKSGQADKAEHLLDKAAVLDPENKAQKLGTAYNSIGDYYQDAQKFDKAIPFFKKGAAVAKDDTEKAYSDVSIATCYFAMEQPKNAVPFLEDMLKLKNISDDDRKTAEEMLKAAQKG
jgi:tetratricopeptide (TPR) repeat protein